MSKIQEKTLLLWTKPPSDTEELKLQNAQRMVKEALKCDETLKTKNIDIFGQGSYANDTNVKLNSDIDINVCCLDCFFYDLGKGITEKDVGLDVLLSPKYSYQEYKNDVEQALKNYFGRENVLRKNKCLTVLGNSYRVQTDIVPTWEYKRYDNKTYVIKGTKFISDNYDIVINYPKQHIENAIQKNRVTFKRFKRLTRIHKKLRYKMIDDKINISDNITSFLLECLVWNLPNEIFNSYDTWNDALKQSIIYIYNKTKNRTLCNEWGEVSELLYLFSDNRKWTVDDVNHYMMQTWNYLEYK